MDRSYLLQSRNHPTIMGLGETLFRNSVFQNEKLQGAVIKGILDLFGEERRFHRAEREPTLLKASLAMVHDLHVYSKVFEPRFLEDSKEFFQSMAKDLTSKKDLATYVRMCDNFRTDELARCGYFALESRTRRDLVTIMDKWLVSNEVEVLTKTEDIARLLDEKDVDSLERIYSLLERVESQAKLRNSWETYIRGNGTSIVLDEENQSEMVVRLLELKTRLDDVWRTSFHKHEELGHVLRESFASFINERKKGSRGASNSRPGEMIAKYVDMLLRGGIKAVPPVLASSVGSKRLPSALSSIGSGKDFGAEEEDVDMEDGDEDVELSRQLDQVLDLFRFIEGKDVFEAFYKKDLARRLLMNRSASADAERMMLARLKTGLSDPQHIITRRGTEAKTTAECGAGFTHNLEQMFKDVDLARDEMASYKAMRAERGISKRKVLDLNVNVLSAAAWPTYPEVPVTIPPEIARAIDDYDAHYKQKHTGRRLTWKHGLAHCVVRAQFPKGQKELGVSSFQAIVLLLFNELANNETLTYPQIQDATGLCTPPSSPSPRPLQPTPPANPHPFSSADVELTRTVQSLACARHRVLRKTPHSRDINPAGDVFAYNPSFTSPLTRIKINQIQLRETRAENLATHDDVHRDRQYETQAAIVRIMKGLGDGGDISFAELQAETIKATRKRGALGAGEIKGQIDKLIEKEYLERTAGGRFRYLA